MPDVATNAPAVFDPAAVYRNISGGAVKPDNTVVKGGTQTGTIGTVGTSTTDTNQTQKTGTVEASKITENSTTDSLVRNLTAEQMAVGTEALNKLGTSFKPADLSAISQRITGVNNTLISGSTALLQRAQGADATLAASRSALLAKAQQDTQASVTARLATLSRQAGTAFSSAVQRDAIAEVAKSNVDLAAFAAQQERQDRSIVTDEILKGLGAVQSTSSTIGATELSPYETAAKIDATRAGAIAAITDSLKGGVVSGHSSTSNTKDTRTETQSTVNSSSRAITNSGDKKIVDLNDTSVQVGTGIAKDKLTLEDILKLVF